MVFALVENDPADMNPRIVQRIRQLRHQGASGDFRFDSQYDTVGEFAKNPCFNTLIIGGQIPDDDVVFLLELIKQGLPVENGQRDAFIGNMAALWKQIDAIGQGNGYCVIDDIIFPVVVGYPGHPSIFRIAGFH